MNVCIFVFRHQKWQKKILQYREQPLDIKFHYLNLTICEPVSNLTRQQPHTSHIVKINPDCIIEKKLYKISYFHFFRSLEFSHCIFTSSIKFFISVSFVPHKHLQYFPLINSRSDFSFFNNQNKIP